MGDLTEELGTLRRNLKARTDETKALRRERALLEDYVSASGRGGGAGGLGGLPGGGAHGRATALFERCLSLRRRIAQLTTDGVEYRRMAREGVRCLSGDGGEG